ncbi:MAG: N-acetylglucosamine-6-phosphate deacetylase [Planctomycetota bacterium]|jgi:N-acetylglucosamine-6-phosphate deacetylase
MIESTKNLPQEFTGPGLVDLQVNGYAGFDFNGPPDTWNAEKLQRIRGLLHRRGISAVFVSLITDETEMMLDRVKRYAELIENDDRLASTFPKLHIEGPFIASADGPRGCHNKRYCTTPGDNPDFIDRLQDASGSRIGIVTLAPELPGAIELIARLSEMNICPAIGHTAAGSEILAEAVSAGAKLSTHLGNGSHQMLDRLDNYVQRQLADDRLLASFIPDGHAMPLSTLKNFIRAKHPQRSLLTSDATAAAESPPGEYALAGMLIVSDENGLCRRPNQSNLAGTTLTLDRGVINVALNCDVSFEQAWAMASSQPAALTGLAPCERVTVRISEDGFHNQDLPPE